MPVVDRLDYTTPLLLRHNVAMYLWANGLRKVPKPPYEPFERVDTPPNVAGSFFELAWWRVEAGKCGDKVALIAPGLNGGAYAQPTRGMARALHEEGWDVAVWVYRDTGTNPTSVRRTYSGYGFDDLSAAVDRLGRDYDDISLVGLSLGANIVIQYVCALGDNPVSKAVVFSPPIAFGATVEHWSTSIAGRLAISPLAKRSMKKLVKRKASSTGVVTRDDVKAYRNVRVASEADHYINSEFNEYPGASQYWQKAATLTALATSTTTALLVVLAKDDYMLESHSYPHAENLAPSVTIELTTNGSHISFVPRGWKKHRYWSEQRAIDHLS
ncbi:MAG: alpha/beta fold hydrolase [Actinomycetota bacterium]